MRMLLLVALTALALPHPAPAEELSRQEKEEYCKKLRFLAKKASAAQWRGVSEAEFQKKLRQILQEEGVSPRGIRESKKAVRKAYEANDRPSRVAEQAWQDCWETMGEEPPPAPGAE